MARGGGGTGSDDRHYPRGEGVHRRPGEQSPFVANMAWRALRSFYRWADAEGECENIAERIRQAKMPIRTVKSVTEEQYRRLIVFCTNSGWYGTRDTAIFAVLWSTGLRRTELANLQVDDVNTKDGTVLVRESKNGSYRVAYLTTEASK